jgi:hypothetical protein
MRLEYLSRKKEALLVEEKLAYPGPTTDIGLVTTAFLASDAVNCFIISYINKW